MKISTASAVLPCTPETFWAAFLDESYLRALYLEELECPAFDVIEVGESSRKLRIVPKMKLPAPVAKLIGDSFAYEDHGTLDRARNEWTWRMVQPANLDPKSKPRKDVVAMHGTVRIEAAGEGHCRRTDDFSIEAKIFGLGSLIESSIDKELLSARAKEYAFFARWVDKSFAKPV
ncbi:MAG: DUF2505 domain-containing protein [Myxococcales bacterium]|nr:DUF2505 domain-containing protein [Myxococcales bacterium]